MTVEEWREVFEKVPESNSLSEEEMEAWLGQLNNVALASDAFFPFTDNVRRAKQVF